MTVSGKDKRGLVEELRTLRTRLDRLEHRNAELVQTEQELRESLEQFNTIFDDSLVGMYHTTPDGRILMANSALISMLGYSSFDELARRNLENEGYEPGYPRSAFKSRIEREGKVSGLESAWKRCDGTTAYVRESAKAIRDESGRTLYYQGTVEDITEHRQTKKALQASEEKFGALAASLNEGVNIVDENLQCVFANTAGEEIFGVEPGGLVGRKLDEFVSEQNRAILQEQRSKRREGIASSYEIEITRPDGQKRQLIVTGTSRFSEDGDYKGAIAVFFDVTEKKQAEKILRKAHDELEIKVQHRTAELEQANKMLKAEIAERIKTENRLTTSELQYRTTLDSMGDAIHVVDADLRIVLMNDKFHTWAQDLGFDVSDAVGRSIFKLFPFLHETVRDEYLQVFEERRILTTEEVNHFAGREVVTETRKIPILREGRVVEVVTVIRDITERRQADRQIRERAIIIDSTADSVIKTDAGGIVTMWNRGAERIFGYTSEEMMGKPITILYRQQDQSTLSGLIETLLRGEEIATTEVTCVHKDGSLVELALSLFPLRDAGGSVAEFVGISKDITDRKRAEEQLCQSENRYRAVVENAGEGIVVVQDGMLRFVNPRHTFVTGRSKEESMSRPFIEFVHPDDRERVMDIHTRRLRGNQVPPVYELRVIDKEGKTRWLENNGVLIEWNGKPASLNFLRDVTARKNAEEALRKSEEILAESQRIANLGSWSLDLVTRKEIWSDNTYHLLDLDPEEVEPSYEAFLNTIHPDDRDKVDRSTQQAVMDRKSFQHEFRIIRKDGSERWIHSQGRAFFNEAGEPFKLVGISQDITERKQAHEALKTSAERFRLAQQASQTGVWERNLTNNIVYWSEHVETMFGMKGRTFDQRFEQFLERIVPEDRERIEREISTALAEGRGFTTEYRITLPDGSIRWMTDNGQIFNDRQDNPTRLVGTVRDITETKKAEEAIQRQTELLDSIRRAQTRYITEDDPQDIFDTLLEVLVQITDSEYGFLDEVCRDENGELFKKSLALSDISWDEESRGLYEKLRASNMEFRNLDNLSGLPARTGKLVISNDAAHDPRSGGLPKGHPAIDAYMGIPMYFGGELVGVAGVANRKGGYDEQMAAFLETFIFTCAGVIHAVRESRKKQQMADALLEEARQQQIILDSMPCVAMLMRPHTREIVASNKAAVEVGAVPGKTCFETWAKSNSPCPWCLAPELWATGQSQHCEPADGDRIWDAHWIPVSDDLYMHYAFDITERRRAQEKLAEAELRYRTVAAFAYDWEYWENPDGSLRYVSPSCERITGYRVQEFIDDSELLFNIILPEDRDIWNQHHSDALERHNLGEAHFRIRHRDGQIRWIEHTCQPVTEADGKFLGFRGSNRNVTERIQAEQALKETKGLLETIFEHTHILVAYLDPQFNFVRVNRAYAQADGHEPSFYPGKNHFDLFPNAENEEIFRMVTQTGLPYSTYAKPFEYTEHPERGVSYWDWSLVPIKQQDGFVSGLVLTLVDVTERKEAEQALQDSEEKFRRIFELSPYATLFADLDGRILACNQQFCRMHRTQGGPEAQVGRKVTHFFPAEERATLRARMSKTVQERKSQGLYEYMMLREDGTTFPVEACSTIVADHNGTPQGMLAIAHDITERRHAENTLRESEERFRQFFENEPEYCYMVSPEGTILDVNAAALKVLAYKKEDLIGQPLRSIYTSESLPKVSKLFEKWRHGESIENEELTILTQGGAQRTVLLSAGTVRNSNGEILYSVSVQRDITELKKAEQALLEREATLASIFRAAPVGIGLERNRRLSRVNDQVCAMLGYSREELIGQQAVMFYPTRDDYERVRQKNRPQILEMGAATVETRWKHKDGHIIDVLLSTSVLDADDFSKGVTFTALDITERKRAEELLRESEEKFRSLAEQSPNMIFINQGGRIIYANTMCKEVMGYTREQLYSPDFDFLTLIAPESTVRVKESFARHSRGREVEPYEYTLITKEGQRIEAINASKLIQYGGRKAILGIVTNITEFKKAERTLRESQERLKILFESAPDAIYLIDSEGRFVDGNRASEELVGFPKAELIGKSLAESGLMRPVDSERAAGNLRKAAAGEPAGPSEYLITRKDGSHIAIETRIFPVKIGGRTLCLGIARDTTARKRVEEALRASENKFRSIFETAANLIASVTAEGIIVDCNDRVREFLGYEKEEVLGHSMAKIMHPDYLSKAESALKEILAQGFSYNKEYKMVRKDGSVIDVSINSSAIDDQTGKNTRTLCIIDNITERKQAQQKLLDDREQLKSLASQLSLTEERERHRLATELHDHIGQSLVISKIKLDQLRKCESGGAMTEALNEVSRCLGQVIANTRTLTFDLSYPILYELGFEAAVAEWLTEQIEEEHGIKTCFEDDKQSKPLDDDIRALLFRNVRELLINVVKHAQASHVTVSVGRADKDICVCVEDDGVGFDSVEVAAMAAKRAEFGLFSIRERLEQLDGHIEIESKPGQGTRITMRAPLKRELLNEGTET